MLKSTSGGSKDTELNELIVMPIRSPAASCPVRTMIPVGKTPKASLNWRLSNGTEASPPSAGEEASFALDVIISFREGRIDDRHMAGVDGKPSDIPHRSNPSACCCQAVEIVQRTIIFIERFYAASGRCHHHLTAAEVQGAVRSSASKRIRKILSTEHDGGQT